jgi:uncharacterized protein YbjT (DUF2867 family)
MPRSETSAMPETPNVLVVGATGYLGTKIQQAMAGRADVSVRAMSRRAKSEAGWVQADLMDPASLDRALQGVDVVVSSANGYMKETIAADFVGNRNLIEAAARAGVRRFVFLSVVGCDLAPEVPHFHAKKVAEDLIRASGIPFVFVRAPAFLDQADDYLANGLKKGRFYGIGDRDIRWSYVLTDDLAACLARAATHPDPDILNQTIDVSWSDGPHSQRDLSRIVAEVTGKRASLWVIPWWVLRLAVRPVRVFSDLGYDLLQMFLFFRTGKFAADTSLQSRFFGPPPSARDAIARWAKRAGLVDQTRN